MFERFTAGARQAIGLAQEEARRFRHHYIGTEHLLIGIAGCGEDATEQALAEVGLDVERVRTALELIVGRGAEEPSGHIPFTPRAKKMIEYALREALQLGDTTITSAHLLLGLVHDEGGVGARILVESAGSLDRVREAVLARRAATGRSDEPPRIEDVTEEGLLRFVVDLAMAEADRGSPPFAAVVVRGGELLASGVDRSRAGHDPTAHAEITAIRDACRNLRRRSLTGATLVASCEPCAMCQAAAVAADIERIVYAAPRFSAAVLGESVVRMRALSAGQLVHRPVDGADAPFHRYVDRRREAGC
jgi:tRNA(Arg) A34 adenosine deaminase TadA